MNEQVIDRASIRETIIQRFRLVRGNQTKTAFALSIGLSPQAYQRYEGKRVPRAEILVRTCIVHGINMDWLFAVRNAPMHLSHGDRYKLLPGSPFYHLHKELGI